MRLVILSRQESLYSTRVLVEAARKRGHQVEVMDTLQFDIRVSKQNPELFYRGEPVGPVDAVIPRIGASITFFGLAVVRQFEMKGVYCLNESQAIARSRDKLRCLQILSRHDIGLPPTVYTRQAEHVPDCIKLTPGKIGGLRWLPPSCAYRRVHEGRGLAWWHPLVSGDPETVHTAGVSIRRQTISETALATEEDALDFEAPEWMVERGSKNPD